MKRTLKRGIAALLGLMTLATPALADDFDFYDEAIGYCKKYTWITSNSMGGEYVGGTLIYETTATITRTTEGGTTTTTVKIEGSAGVSTTSMSTSTSSAVSSGNESTTVTATEPLGYYAMNDGTSMQLNCVTGERTIFPKK